MATDAYISTHSFEPGFQFTSDQEEAVHKLDLFFKSEVPVFLLKGHAGTGKTTLIKAIVSYLRNNRKNVALMAPTGRAARVMTEKTKYRANTIHKSIYNFSNLEEIKSEKNDKEFTLRYFFSIRQETDNLPHVIIVDEASMVSDVDQEQEFFRFGSGLLLKDLLTFSRCGLPGMKLKIIFSGDPAQLPPIGMNFSPALDSDYLQEKYGLESFETTMKQVVRQDAASVVLKEAHQIRESLEKANFNRFHIEEFPGQIEAMGPDTLTEKYIELYPKPIMIAYTNKTVNQYNQWIRRKLGFNENSLQVGEKIIVSANNYHHDVMNGEFGMVKSIEPALVRHAPLWEHNEKVSVRLSWSRISLQINGHPELVHGFILDNFLENGEISARERKALYVDFLIRHGIKKSNDPEIKVKIKDDALFNALRIRHGYAVTCHKAQGGEWDNVMIVWDYANVHGVNNLRHEAFFRWAYTAITRSANSLYNCNPPSWSDVTVAENLLARDQIISLNGSGQKDESLFGPEEQDILQQHGLEQAPDFIREKFIRLVVCGKPLGIFPSEITIQDYLIDSIWELDRQFFRIQFHFNKKNQFRPGSGIKIPANLKAVVEQWLQAEQNEPKEQEDEENEDNPLVNLVTSTCEELKVSIIRLEHLNFRERFVLSLAGQQQILDVLYNGKGKVTKIEFNGAHPVFNEFLQSLKSKLNLK